MQKKFKIAAENTQLKNIENKEEYPIIVENIWKSFRVPIDRRFRLHKQLTNFILRKKTHNSLSVLKGISFNVRKGEILGIIGENGSGKSTLLKLIARIIYPDEGRIEVNGNIASFIELGVGFDFDLTAEENIFLYGAIIGLPREYIKKNIRDIYEFAELEKFRYMKLRNFSSGMVLRLAFSTAIQLDPEILLLDEVLAVGDLDFQKKCFEKMEDLMKRKKTIIYVSHDLATVKKICDSVMWLHSGKIASYGESEKVIKDYLDYMNKKNQ